MSKPLEQQLDALQRKLKLLEKAGPGAAFNAAATASKICEVKKMLKKKR